MNSYEISMYVDNMIWNDQLDVHQGIKPIKKWDGLYPDDVEEREAYFDFIGWYMSQDHLLLDYITV